MTGVDEKDELADYLESLERDSCLRVERVLKESPSETTELVVSASKAGPYRSPVVRKSFTASGTGGACSLYRSLAGAYKQGKRFRHLPCVYDCYEVDGKMVVLMEYVEGPTLREFVGEGSQRACPEVAVAIFASLLPAVAEFHSVLGPGRPVVHRDLTPSNVICPAADPTDVKLIDFGIARVWHAGADRDTRCFGTRPYAPPEQFGFGQTDVRTDVYALGLILFFCLTGRDATQADREAGFADPAVPEPLRRVVVRAAELDPHRRYADASELARALDLAVDELGLADDGCDFSGVCADLGECPSGQLRLHVDVEWQGVEGHGHDALVARPRRAPSKPSGAVPPRAGLLWNAVLISITCFFVFISYYGLLNPSYGLIPDDTPLQRAFSLGIFLPVLFGSLCYALLDRRHLWPRLLKRQPGPLRKRLLICLAILLVDFLGFFLVYLPDTRG